MSIHVIPQGIDILQLSRLSAAAFGRDFMYDTNSRTPPASVTFTPDLTAEETTTFNGFVETLSARSNFQALPQWATWTAAGGRTLISEQTPSGTGTVSFTSIPGSYKKLTIEFDARSTESATNVTHAIQLNGDTTGGNYRSSRMLSYGVNSVTGGGGDDGVFSEVPGATAPANSFSNGNIEIVQYAATSFSKIALTRDAYRRDASSIHLVNFAGAVEWENTAAITRIDLVLSAGNYDSGSVFRLYGEN